MSPQVCAITVTFNPDIEILGRQLNSLSVQCNVVVVDNASGDSVRRDLFSVCEKYSATFVVLDENYGIAHAQNEGVKVARHRYPGCAYLLFLDHDSVPTEAFVDTMLDQYQTLEKAEKVAAIGPSLFDPRTGDFHGFHVIKGMRYLRVNPADMKQDAIECSTVNSSGTLCSLTAFDDVGGYDEHLFIDQVETEWCFRARKAGYHVYGSRTASMEHRMGDDVVSFSFMAKEISLPYRNPLRHRYLVRNSVLLLRRGYVPPVWKFYCIGKLLLTFVLFGFFVPESREQRESILRGIRDGIGGVTGRITN